MLGLTTFSTDIYSETFIRQHIELLPFPKILLQGFDLATTADGYNLLSRQFLGRTLEKFRKLTGTFNFEQFRTAKIAEYLKSTGVSVVLAEYGTVAVKMAGACDAAQIPLVAHFHGFDAYVDDILKKNAAGYQKVFQQAAAIIAVSGEMCEQLVKLGAPREKVHRIPYYVNTDDFTSVQAGENHPIFLCVGRFVEKKAPHLSLMAFAEVFRQAPQARLKFIGDGALLGPTRQLARALSLEHSVEFLGSQPHGAVAEQMRRARCFVQHSVRAENGDTEGTPVSILEAQATGLPVVATRHAGIRDVVVEGETGFLVDECDVDEMAARMLSVIEDPDLASRLGEAGARRIRTSFNRERTMGRLEKVIAGLMQ